MPTLTIPAVSYQRIAYPDLTNWAFPRHCAPYWHFYWNDRDGAFVTIKNKKYALKTSHYYLIPAHTVFTSGNDVRFKHFYIHFHVSLNYPSGLLEFPMSPYIRERIDYIIERLDAESTSKSKSHLDAKSTSKSDFHLDSAIFALLHESLLHVPTEEAAPSPITGPLARLPEFIWSHLGDDLSNTQLAEQIGMHTNAFIRRFRQAFSISPQKYVTMQRCNRARFLLEEETLSIDEIAEACGFCDRYHFSRVFRKNQDLPPAAYRRFATKACFGQEC